MMYTNEADLKHTIQMLMAMGASADTIELVRAQLRRVEELNILHGATRYTAELALAGKDGDILVHESLNDIRNEGLEALKEEDPVKYESAITQLKTEFDRFRKLHRSQKK